MTFTTEIVRVWTRDLHGIDVYDCYFTKTTDVAATHADWPLAAEPQGQGIS